MSDCLFCKIIKGEIPAAKVYEDEHVLAFEDVAPQAPTHVLVIPKKHIPTILDIEDADRDVLGRMFQAANKIAAQRGHDGPGFRTVLNCNAEAGQTVFHIHLHLLAGKPMGWPPWPL